MTAAERQIEAAEAVEAELQFEIEQDDELQIAVTALASEPLGECEDPELAEFDAETLELLEHGVLVADPEDEPRELAIAGEILLPDDEGDGDDELLEAEIEFLASGLYREIVDEDEAEQAEAEADADGTEAEADDAEELLLSPLPVPFWSALNRARYALARGLRGMGQSPLVQLVAVGTMAVCMLLLGTTLLIFQNAHNVAHSLGVDVPVTVFMAPGAPASETLELRDKLAALPEVERAERVTPEQALDRLRDGVGEGLPAEDFEAEELLAGIEPASLPDSIELSLVAGVEPGFADELAARVQGFEGVEEVSVLGPWVQRVDNLLASLRWLALGVGLLVSLACLAIVANTIRLGVFARRAELEILRLVGGTTRFVRGPFVVEGVIQGLLGTALALAGLWLAFELVAPMLEPGLSLVFAADSIEFFSLAQIGLALGFGALLGLIGARAAVARHAEA